MSTLYPIIHINYRIISILENLNQHLKKKDKIFNYIITFKKI